MKSYDQFLEDLSGRESGGNYQSINKKTLYLGKYQMGKLALIDSGYYRHDGKRGNSFSEAFWTGKDSVNSKTDFLNNPNAQENAIREYMKVQWNYLLTKNVDRYIGQTKHGIFLTISGVLAGAHLVGWSTVSPFIKKGTISRDGNKTPITEYIKKFSGYDTPFKPRKKLTGIKRDAVTKKTVMYQIDGNEWVLVSEAIQIVRDNVLDGVIATNSKGTIFLKTPPDHSMANNLG